MKPIVWIVLPLWVVGCGGTNYFFENTDATANAWDGNPRQTGFDADRESGTIADVAAGSTDAEEASIDATVPQEGGNLREAGSARDAGRDVGADAAVRDATAK
ncbi:MAG: hypothetical protein M3O36_05045, partial [Myxococcota bacterium]|nr:hypothetical protein [Myxococcota bacterium]